MSAIDKQLDSILDRFSKAHPFADTRAYNIFHEKAIAQLKTLIAVQVAAARIDELQLLDKNLESNKLRYYFKPYFDERLKQLQNKTNDGGRNES